MGNKTTRLRVPRQNASSIKTRQRLTRSSRPLLWVTGVFVYLALSIAPAAAYDVAVGDILVTQGVQHTDPFFWVPLVAQRSTAVRVHIRCINGIPGPVFGTLKAFVDGQEVTPPGGMDDINQQFPNANGEFVPTCGRLTDVLPYEEDMLTFELPAPNGLAPSGGQTQTNNVFFQVQLSSQGDTDPNNNSAWTDNLTVVQRAEMRLYKLPIAYRPNGGTPATVDPDGNPVPGNIEPNPAFIAPGMGDAMAPAIWPMSDADPYAPGQGSYWDNGVFPPLLPGFTFEDDCNGDGLINDGPGVQPGCSSATLPAILRYAFPSFVHEFDALIAHLLARRFMLIEHGVGPTSTTFLYGWLADGNVYGAAGYALTGGSNVGFGTDNSTYGQLGFAHEFGHMSADLPHNQPAFGIDEYGWDVGARLHNNPNPMPPGVSGRIKPWIIQYYGEVMNPTVSPTAERWIDLSTYEAALNHPRLAAETSSLCDNLNCRELETIVVHGVPGLDDAGRIQMGARTLTYPWYAPPPAEPDQANVMVSVTIREPGATTSKTIQVPVDARGIIEHPNGKHREVNPAPFAVPISVPKGTTLQALRLDGLGDHRFSTKLTPSASIPSVEIVSPEPGATLSAKTKITWAGAAADKGSRLSYQVAYSPTDGQDFIPIAVDVQDTSVAIDASTLPKTELGRGLLRVFVNDGLNTSYADVKGLSIGK
jgi:hypothetical protein